MATAEIADAYLQQVHSARTQLQACFRRAHEILTDREADLLRQLDDIQTSYEQETKIREEEIQDLEKSKLFLKTSLHDNDTLNKALVPLTDKLEQILRLASAARTVRFQWNTAFEDDFHHVGEIITNSSVPPAVIPQTTTPHSNLTPVFPQTTTPHFNFTPVFPQTTTPHSNLTHVFPQTTTPHSNLTPVIPQTTVPHFNFTPIIPQTTTPHSNFTPIIPQTTTPHSNFTPVIPQTTVPHSNLAPVILQTSSPQPNLTISIPDYRYKSIPVFSWCRQGTAPGQLSWPRGLAIEPQFGRIFIADSLNNRVQVYSPDVEYCFMFNIYMDRPTNIYFSNNTVYVSQVSSHCITLYTLDGEYLNKIG